MPADLARLAIANAHLHQVVWAFFNALNQRLNLTVAPTSAPCHRRPPSTFSIKVSVWTEGVKKLLPICTKVLQKFQTKSYPTVNSNYQR